MRSLVVALAAVAITAAAAVAAPADAVRTRVAGLRELGAAFKSVNDTLRSNQPQPILIQESAREIRKAANQMPAWFPAGSGREAGVKTAAKPDIWSDPAKFKAAQDAFIAQAAKFQAVSAGGDVDAMRTEARNLGATCKSCHDSFRIPSA